MVARLAILLLGLAATVGAFLVPPAEEFREPELARILVFHLPCALVCAALIVGSGWFGLRVLTGRTEADAKLETSNELAALMGALTLGTGILFSKVQWGTWWQWDPRQTSFLMVELLLLAALALRAGQQDEARRARTSAAYALATLLPLLFFVFVFPRLKVVTTFHPDLVGQGMQGQPTMSSDYRLAVLAGLLAVSAATWWLFRIKVRTLALERRIGESNELADGRRDDSSGVGVVRPVAVRPANREAVAPRGAGDADPSHPS